MPKLLKCSPVEIKLTGKENSTIFHCPACGKALKSSEPPEGHYCYCLNSRCQAVFIGNKILSEEEIETIFPDADF